MIIINRRDVRSPRSRVASRHVGMLSMLGSIALRVALDGRNRLIFIQILFFNVKPEGFHMLVLYTKFSMIRA